MDGSGGRHLPLEWLHPGPYGYDPYTNSLVPLRDYGYGFGVEYIWNPPVQHQGHMQNFSAYSSSSSIPLGRRPPLAAAQRGRGRGRGRRRMRQPRQHGGPGLLGSDPSSQRPSQLPPPRRSAPDEPSSSQPPAQLQPPLVPVSISPENKDPTPPPPPASSSSSPSSHAMTPPVLDPAKDSHGGVDVSMTAAAKMDDSQDDVVVGLSGSSTAATDKKRLLPLDPPAPVKNSVVDVSMAHRDDDQGDVLGLNLYMTKKRLLSTKASSLAAVTDAEEEAKAAARNKKTRLGWGQGLAKFENRYKKDDENSHKLVAHDGATGEAASSHGSIPPPGSKGPGDNNSLHDMAEMRVSHVTTAPVLFSKGSSRPLTGDLGDLGKNGSISSLTESPADEVPAGFSGKHRPSPAGGILFRGSIFPKVSALPHKGSPPLEDNNISNYSSMTAIAVSELAASSQGNDAPPDESSMKFTKVEDIPPRMEKVIVKMVQRPRKIKKMNVFSDEEPGINENDAAPLVPGIATLTATKNYERMNAEAEAVKKPVNQICHDSTANLPDKGHGKSSKDGHEHVTGKVLVGESKNCAPSPLGMRSSEAACLTIPKTEAPVLENFNEGNSSNEAVCITRSSSKVKENVPQSVLIANHGDQGNCVAGASCGQDTVKIMFFPDEISAKLANGTFKDDQVRSGANKTPDLSSSVKEWNLAAKHHSWKATEKKLANSNIDDGRMASSDMENPNSKDNPCNTSDPAAMLTGPAFIQYMMEYDQAVEKEESEKNNDKVKGKEMEKVLCVSSKHGSGIQLSCEMNSQKEMEKVDSIPSPEGNDLNADMENPTKGSSPCVATKASVVGDDGLIERLRASETTYRNSENNDAKVKSMEENPVQSVASKQCNGLQLSCSVTSQKGKGIMPSPEVNDLNEPPMQISDEAPKTYHLPSSSGYAALDIVDANSSYVAMDIDLNIPLDVSIVDLGNSSTDSEATDSDATIEISPSQTTTTVTQTAQQQPANQPGSMMLFGRVVHQAPSTGTTNHTPNQRNQTVVPSSNVPFNPVVSMTRQSGRGHVYPSWATTTSVWRGGVPNNQLGQQAVLSNRMLYGGSTNGASSSSASPLQPGTGSRALVNMVNQQRQQALANITPYNILRGGVPAVPASPHLIQGSSSGGAGMAVNFSAFNSVPQQWQYPVIDTSIRLVVGLPSFYYPSATANRAPATAPNTMLSIGTNNGEVASTSNIRAPANTMLSIGTNNGEGASTSSNIRAPANTMLSIGTNNGEGASTSNTRAPPSAGRGRGRGGPNSWLSLGHNNQE